MVVTHIHLDHTGGAGDIAAATRRPRSSSTSGARHLAAPRLLMAGAEMAFGDALDRLFRRLSPVPKTGFGHLTTPASWTSASADG